MADQPDDSNGDPAVKFRKIVWAGPVVVPGPHSEGYVDPSAPHAGSVDFPDEEQHAVDTPVSAAEVSLCVRSRSPIGKGISEGRIRDSLELAKYLPPHPLGVRRASQLTLATLAADVAAEESAAQQPAAGGEGGGELPPTKKMMPPDGSGIPSFTIPGTLLRGDESPRRRRGKPEWALDVVRPYPNVSRYKPKKKRAAPPVDLGPLPERLLKRPKGGRSVSVSHTPGGSVITMIKVLDEAPQGEASKAGDVVEAGDVKVATAAPAEAAGRRFGPVGVLARKILKDKTNDATQQEKITTAGGEGKGKGKALDVVEAGESARGKEHHAADEPQVDAAQGAHEGEHAGNAINAGRKVRKVVGRYFKVSA